MGNQRLVGRRRENSLGAPDEPLVGTSWEHCGGNPTSWASRGDRGDGRMKSYLFNPAGGIKKSLPRINDPAVYYFFLLFWGPRPGPRRSPSGRQVAPPCRFGLDSFFVRGEEAAGKLSLEGGGDGSPLFVFRQPHLHLR